MKNSIIPFVLVPALASVEIVVPKIEGKTPYQGIELHTHSANSSQGWAFTATLTKTITVSTNPGLLFSTMTSMEDIRSNKWVYYLAPDSSIWPCWKIDGITYGIKRS